MSGELTSKELLPCPCCGRSPARIVWNVGDYPYRVECSHCFLQTGACLAKEGAAMQWNKRAPVEPSVYDRNSLHTLIDEVWNAATDSPQVPHTKWADEIIDKWTKNSTHKVTSSIRTLANQYVRLPHKKEIGPIIADFVDFIERAHNR